MDTPTRRHTNTNCARHQNILTHAHAQRAAKTTWRVVDSRADHPAAVGERRQPTTTATTRAAHFTRRRSRSNWRARSRRFGTRRLAVTAAAATGVERRRVNNNAAMSADWATRGRRPLGCRQSWRRTGRDSKCKLGSRPTDRRRSDSTRHSPSPTHDTIAHHLLPPTSLDDERLPHQIASRRVTSHKHRAKEFERPRSHVVVMSRERACRRRRGGDNNCCSCHSPVIQASSFSN